MQRFITDNREFTFWTTKNFDGPRFRVRHYCQRLSNEFLLNHIYVFSLSGMIRWWPLLQRLLQDGSVCSWKRTSFHDTNDIAFFSNIVFILGLCILNSWYVYHRLGGYVLFQLQLWLFCPFCQTQLASSQNLRLLRSIGEFSFLVYYLASDWAVWYEQFVLFHSLSVVFPMASSHEQRFNNSQLIIHFHAWVLLEKRPRSSLTILSLYCSSWPLLILLHVSWG